MKNFIFILLTLSQIPLIFAQDPGFRQEWAYTRRGYIGISVGAAIPTGNFASTDIDDEYAGYAQTGFSLQLVNFGYRFGNRLGLAAMWSGAAFKMDAAAFGKSSGLGSNNFETDYWSSGALMAGLLVSVPSTIMDVDFRIMAGPSYGQSPEVRYSGIIEGQYINFVQESGASYTFGFDAGVGLRFNLFKFLNLNLLFDYAYAKHKFEVNSYANGTLIDTPEFKQPMGYFTITGGLAFRIK